MPIARRIVLACCALQWNPPLTPIWSVRRTCFLLTLAAAFDVAHRTFRRCEDLGKNSVWQKTMWTDTHNYFLVKDLAQVIDEDPADITRTLKVLVTGWEKPLFLRAHGILTRDFAGRKTYCLLGVGPLYLTFVRSGLAYAMNAEPKGSFL